MRCRTRTTLRIATLLDDGTALSFVDQRTFGGWMLADLVTVDGTDVPTPVAHLARDPLDPKFNRDAVVKVLRRKHSEIKRQLLDQTVVSGIGNIYADEALWRAKVNGARLASSLTRAKLGELLDAAADVMTDALGQGGTSFDSLYVNVNGESGYFDRSLDAYGREGRAVPALRRGDAAGEVHEPVVVLLPEMPTAPAGAAQLNCRVGPHASPRVTVSARRHAVNAWHFAVARGKEMSHDRTVG